MYAQLRPALILLGVFTVLTGIIYPLVVTGLALLVFPEQARGSLLRREGQVFGSALIGQPFDSPRYFWGRPSATTPFPNNSGASGGSNVGPTNKTLIEDVQKRVEVLRASEPQSDEPIPVDLVTTSASGLDPHISPAAAAIQLPRVAKARGLSEEWLRFLVREHTEERFLGIFGEPRVNVLQLNLALDGRKAP